MNIDTLKIRMLHSEKGWSQAELAKQAGMNRASISALINRGTCYASSLYKIAKALNVDPSELIRKDI